MSTKPFPKHTHGSLIDRSPDEASKTAKHASRALVNAAFGSITLSLVGGFVDTAGFIMLFGLFTAHVTGDMITAAAAIAAGPDLGAWGKITMVPVFIISVGFITLFTRSIKRRGAATLAPLFAMMTLALGLFCLAGEILHPFAKNADSVAVAVIGGFGVAAMGVQNALMKGALRSFAQTTLMTGNLTQFTIDLVDFIFPPADKYNKKERARLRRIAAPAMIKSFFPLFGFIAGAALGAWLTKLYGFRSLLAPTGIVAILTLIAAIRHR
jgi:uncharacterized membrane protein YoaK (UPF0700 family)